ncbi:MAG TPA: sigma-54 dependent transcriptional regulator [bacterium]
MNEIVLIVDDAIDIRSSLSGILSDEGYGIVSAGSCIEAEKLLSDKQPDIILLDVWLPDGDGVNFIKKVKEKSPESQIIMISGHGSIETAVRAIKLGANDFLEKPLSIEKVLVAINRAAEISALKVENTLLRGQIEENIKLQGSSSLLEEVKKKIDIFSQSGSPVIIYGESGTGKEVAARLIHYKSPRSSKPFVPVNCAAIPEELIESELFGYEKGAFTGAMGRKKGKFDLAHNGTLFLDEIGDMSLRTQAKILRILQEQTFERVGGTEPISVNVRIIAATNKNLEEEIQNEHFRRDLYFRLKVLPIEMPPLRARKDDIPILINHFLAQFSKIYKKPVKQCSAEAIEAMKAYAWQGNVRELKNVMERLVIMSEGITIEVDDLFSEFKSSPATGVDDVKIYNGSLEKARQEFEKYYIMNKLVECGLNITRTAELLEISRENLSRKIKHLGIKINK